MLTEFVLLRGAARYAVLLLAPDEGCGLFPCIYFYLSQKEILKNVELVCHSRSFVVTMVLLG